ncbi:Phage integrase family protein [Duganella sacchari]|uniref:Phage integrase family protein n=1 Tax=Duganella sacchari TaxID=551987 RepID=A0A1M7M7Z6_9BURK|nr:site-specific integrase [Duganella sacchari]SHM86867.1 Phage integrase family protein [Duganella sacchari]
MSQQAAPFLVKLVRMADGERLPVLVVRATGLPDFDATLWVVSSLRNKNLASETIAQALRSVAVLYLALQFRKVNLSERLRTGNILSLAEVEAISKMCRQTVAASVKYLEDDVDLNDQKVNKVSSLEKFRMARAKRPRGGSVSAGTTAIRLGYIREYLKWRVNNVIARAENEKKANLLALRNLIDDELQNKTPAVTERANEGRRMGLGRQTQERLLRIIAPTDLQNPWTGKGIRLRNQFIVFAILALGVRRGELLGLRVGDFNSQTREVLILRRPDDEDDPRLNEPNTKTRDRVLPVSYPLHVLLKAYLMVRHELVRGKHDFLIVTNSGAPMSKSELNRIFSTLNEYFSEKISPHVLRHTFFDNLAEDLSRANKSDVEINNILTQLGGWSETSDSPRRYTKRFSQERAAEAALALQEKLNIPDIS